MAAALVFALAAAVHPLPAAGQQPFETGARRMLASRTGLLVTLDSLRLLRPSKPPAIQSQLDDEIRFGDQRLEAGDFKVGDRILLQVEEPLPLAPGGGGGGAASKSPEQLLTDTFTVTSTIALNLPLLGAVPLHGVLRSEIEPYLTRQIGTRIRDPQVHARPLVVVAVSGGVLRPGYYSVPADAVIGTVISSAGGGEKEGKITDLKIIQHGKTKWEGVPLQRAIGEGKTLDDLGIQPGDEIAVGQKGSAGDALRTIALILSIPVAILTLSHF
jgi:protein involved in polysaccharide export with SLBB domain